jgi:hypothetical protein
MSASKVPLPLTDMFGPSESASLWTSWHNSARRSRRLPSRKKKVKIFASHFSRRPTHLTGVPRAPTAFGTRCAQPRPDCLPWMIHAPPFTTQQQQQIPPLPSPKLFLENTSIAPNQHRNPVEVHNPLLLLSTLSTCDADVKSIVH